MAGRAVAPQNDEGIVHDGQVEAVDGPSGGFFVSRGGPPQAGDGADAHMCFGAVVLVSASLLCPDAHSSNMQGRVALHMVVGFHGVDCGRGPRSGTIVPRPWGDVATAKLAHVGISAFLVCHCVANWNAGRLLARMRASKHRLYVCVRVCVCRASLAARVLTTILHNSVAVPT